MSLILDALNRSRQETDLVPNLATYHAVEKVASGKRQYLPWLAFVGIAAIVGWLLIARFLSSSVSDTQVGALAEQVPQKFIAAEGYSSLEAAAEGAGEEALIQLAVNSEASPIMAAPVAINAAPEAASIAVALGEKVPISFPAVENSAVVELYQNRDALDDTAAPQQTSPAALALYSAASNEQPIDIAQALQSARDEMKDAALEDHTVPLLSALSQQTKDGIPTLYYQRHDYSNNTSNSTVVLNNETLKVGGSPVNGMNVEEILPDSVILSYEGTQFRLRALNSWVNL
ncbi:MAG: general secretion pathway protein GspB [Halioglobus sp.]|nr:general secretion pathway protein GspB [Halioglobus sp.]